MTIALSRRLALLGSLVLVPAGVATAGAGCSSSSAGATPTPGNDAAASDDGAVTTTDDGGGVDAGTSQEASAPGVAITWKVDSDLVPVGGGPGDAGDAAAPNPPVSGAQICVYGMTSVPCVTTDTAGSFTLPLTELATGIQIVLTVVKTGYRSSAEPIVVPSTSIDESSQPLFLESASDPAPPIGVTVDWTTKGVVSFFALGPGAIKATPPLGDPGATVTLTPMSGVGPLFLTDSNTFDTSATALVDIVGRSYNVAPASYTLTFGDAVNDCEAIGGAFSGWGYPAAKHQVAFPVIAGFTTSVGVFCTPGSVVTDAGDAATVADAAHD
jgi:hypothetical protein